MIDYPQSAFDKDMEFLFLEKHPHAQKVMEYFAAQKLSPDVMRWRMIRAVTAISYLDANKSSFEEFIVDGGDGGLIQPSLIRALGQFYRVAPDHQLKVICDPNVFVRLAKNPNDIPDNGSFA